MLLLGPENLIYVVPAILLAITIHEYSHGRMALAMGDGTAAFQGRLTLNPLAHLDPIGTLMLLFAGFGWAKPVPINPYNFTDYRQGLLKVSLAGPFSNFALAFLSLLVMGLMEVGVFLENFLFVLSFLNIAFGVFNLLPVPPLDGSKVLSSLLPASLLGTYRQIEPYAPLILILLLATGLVGAVIGPLINFIYTVLQTIVNLILGV